MNFFLIAIHFELHNVIYIFKAQISMQFRNQLGSACVPSSPTFFPLLVFTPPSHITCQNLDCACQLTCNLLLCESLHVNHQNLAKNFLLGVLVEPLVMRINIQMTPHGPRLVFLLLLTIDVEMISEVLWIRLKICNSNHQQELKLVCLE